jgi:glucokinase
VALDTNSAPHAPSIGIDIGGTKMLGCLFGENPAEPLASIVRPTERKNGGQAVLQQAAKLVAELQAKASGPVSKIGVALPELVDKDGKPASAWNFDWRGLDVAGTLGVDCPVHLESDVRAAAYAESQLSNLKSYDPFLYVTLSTGIAHTLVINGKPYSGARGYALHFSGSDLVTECQNCKTMSPFNLELFAGGRALGERYSHAKKNPDVTARDLFDSYASDPVANRMVDDAVSALASYLGQLINTLDPAALVIGGGIGTRPDVFERLDVLIREFIWSDGARDLPINSSKLNGNAAAIGAVLLTDEHQGGKC